MTQAKRKQRKVFSLLTRECKVQLFWVQDIAYFLERNYPQVFSSTPWLKCTSKGWWGEAAITPEVKNSNKTFENVDLESEKLTSKPGSMNVIRLSGPRSYWFQRDNSAQLGADQGGMGVDHI